MSVFNGKKLNIEIYGESHSEKIGAFIKGFPKCNVDFEKLNGFLARRKANGEIYSTSRVEKDQPVFCGIKNGKIKGKFSFYILNENVNKKDYDALYGKPRPSHADYAWYLKDGVLDFSGGGRFSGRLTLPLCVVGGICKQYLEGKGIFITSYISQTGKIKGISYKDKKLTVEEIEKKISDSFPSLSKKKEMLSEIDKVKLNGDSVGGRVECLVFNMKQGIGDNLFEGLEGKISSLIYSVPAVKGVEFGLGFGFCNGYGGNLNDGLYYNGQGQIEFKQNNSGGINGGISNGEIISIGVAVKPTPSIAKEQETVDLVNKKNVTVKIGGRHDACILPRALPCIESAVAIALTDEIG